MKYCAGAFGKSLLASVRACTLLGAHEQILVSPNETYAPDSGSGCHIIVDLHGVVKGSPGDSDCIARSRFDLERSVEKYFEDRGSSSDLT